MPKINKNKSRQDRMKRIEVEKIHLKHYMFKSAVFAYVMASLFLIISFLFNGRIITAWVNLVNESMPNEGDPASFLLIADIAIRSLSIMFFFFFGFLSVANWLELRGYVMSWKEMVVLIILSLFQGTINGNVFIFSLIGISLVLIYIYFIQGKIEQEIEY